MEMSKEVTDFSNSTVSLVKTLILFTKDILVIALALIPILLLLLGLFFVSDYTLKNGHVFITEVEYAFRCEIYHVGQNYLPFLNTAKILYSLTVCWTNSVGLLRSLFSDAFLYQQTGLCVEQQSSVIDIIKQAGQLTVKLTLSITDWIAQNPFTSTFSLYDILTELTEITNILLRVLDCLCGLLHPLWKFVVLTIQDNNLYCTLHYAVNSALSIIQITLMTAVEIILDFISSIFSGSILNVLTTIWNLQVNAYSRYSLSFQQLELSMLYIGEYINNIFVNLICIIVSEAEEATNGYNAVEIRFASCVVESKSFKTGYIIGTLLNIAIRAAEALTQLAIGSLRLLIPTDTFKWNTWNPNIVYDSIRKPLNIPPDIYINDPWADLDSTSTIEIPIHCTNVVSCNNSYQITGSCPSCSECSNLFANISFETSLCNVMNQIDDLIEPAINRRFIKVIICDGLFSIVRIFVAIYKGIIDILRTFELTNNPKIFDLLSNPNFYDRILNEIGGPQHEIGGLLYFPNKLIIALVPTHPDLECIPAVITYFLKGLLEIIRSGIYVLTYIISDIRVLIPGFSVTNPLSPKTFVTSYVCVYPYGGPRCINTENILRWYRIPRDISSYYKNEVPFDYVSVGNYRQGAFECLCYIINLRFITSFSTELPLLNGFELPDICCTFYNILRVVISVYEFALNTILAILQTIISTFEPSFTSIFILDYLSCLTNNSGGPCSNINALNNDISDTISCGCTFINDFIAIPSIGSTIDTSSLECLCNFILSSTNAVSSAVIVIRDIAQIIFGVFACIDVSTAKFKTTYECQVLLPLTALDIFARIQNILSSVRNAIGKLTCLISSIFAYNCLPSPASKPCLAVNFYFCVLNKTCTSYAPNETLSNSIPTSEQFADCVEQCGTSICTSCTNKIQANLILYNTSIINCPNGCNDPTRCTPKEKMELLIQSIVNIVVNLLDLILSWISDIIIFIIETSTGNTSISSVNIPTTFTGFLDQFFNTIGDSLLGDARHTWGPIQYFGDFLDCIIGPPGCVQPDSFPPSDPSINFNDISSPSGNYCFGSIFIVFANILAQLFSSIKDVIINFIGIIESIVTGNTSAITQYIKDFVKSIFNLIRTLFKQLVYLVEFFVGFLASLFNLIVPGTYDAIYTALTTIFVPFVKAMQAIFDFLHFFGAVKKRTVEETINGYYDTYMVQWREEFETMFKSKYTFNNSESSTNDEDYPFQTPLQMISVKYQSLFNATTIFTKRTTFSSSQQDTPHISSYDAFQQMYNLSDAEMQIITNPTLLLPIMTNTTMCYKVINTLKSTPPNAMSLSDELLFKLCYSLVLLPLINNNNNVNQTINFPLDFFYNIDTMSKVMTDFIALYQTMTNWNFPLLHSYSLLYNSSLTSFFIGEKRSVQDDYLPNLINTSEYKTFYNFVANTDMFNYKQTILSFLKAYDGMNSVNNTAHNVLNYISLLKNYDNLTMTDYKYLWFSTLDNVATIFNTSEPSVTSNKRNILESSIKSANIFKIASLAYKYKKLALNKNLKVPKVEKIVSNKELQEALKNFKIMRESMKHRIHSTPRNITNTYNLFWPVLYSTVVYTIPKIIDYWKSRYSESILGNTQKRTIEPDSVPKTDGLVYMFKYVIMDRTMLAADILTYIANNELQKIYNNSHKFYSLFLKKNITHNDIAVQNANNRDTTIINGLSIPERIVAVHSKLKNIKKLNIPNLPDTFAKYNYILQYFDISQNPLKRSIVTINCGCNCTILEQFVQQLVDISTFCYEKQFLGIADPLNLSITQTVPTIEIIYYDPNFDYPFPENIVFSWIGVDIISTVANFLTNTNTDISKGPIGLIYFIRRLPIPIINMPCTRINLTCQLGIGLTKGIAISFLIVVIVGIVLYIVSPPVAGIINTVIVGTIFGSLSAMFFILVLTIAWGYQPNCFAPDENSLFSLVFPAINNIKMLPECAAEDIYNFIVTYIVTPCPLESYHFFGFADLISITSNQSTCPSCPIKLNFTSCYDYGFQSPFTVFGLFLLKYVPFLGLFLQNSCLVRGNCFGFLLGSSNHALTNDGLLGALYLNINTTTFLQGNDPILNQCFAMNITSIIVGIISLILICIALLYAIIIIFDIILWIFALLQLLRSKDEDAIEHERFKKLFG